MTFNSILDLIFPRVKARFQDRSLSFGSNRVLAFPSSRRRKARSRLSFAEHRSARQSLLLFATGGLDPPSPRFRPTSLHLLCNYFPTRPRQHSSRLFSLLSNDHCAPRVEQKPGNEFGSFFLAHQPQLFSFNWIV